MEAKGVNQTIWHRQIELRDNGKLSIGTIIWNLAPRTVDNFMTNNMPLLVSHYPVFVMQDPPSFPFQEIYNLVEANQSFTFCENGLKLNVSEVFIAIRTSCSGSLCDRQRLDYWNMNNDKGCGCNAMHYGDQVLKFSMISSSKKYCISKQRYDFYEFILIKLIHKIISVFIFISKHRFESIGHCGSRIFQHCGDNSKRDRLYQQERRFYSNRMVQTWNH